jgi:hypothetical protein
VSYAAPTSRNRASLLFTTCPPKQTRTTYPRTHTHTYAHTHRKTPLETPFASHKAGLR